jgi:hypothetical protein
MKTHILHCSKSAPFIVFFLFVFTSIHAQAPNQLQYQAVIRNASGAVVANQPVGMQVSILKGTATGSTVYAETHRDTTTVNGLVAIEIGAGIVVSGNFGSINWGQGPYFIKTETDITGGTNYLLAGTTQLLSVPYSLYAQSASLKYSAAGDTLFSGKEYVIIPGISSANGNAVVTGSPMVTTSVVSAVTTVSAVLGGEVISIGGSNVISRGICYGSSAAPTINQNTVASGVGLGAFSVTLPVLNPGTQYYARAYATNTTGTSYGNQVTFKTLGAEGQGCAQGSTMTVTHTAGEVAPVTKTVTYRLVQTDLSGESKCWIAQNLGADRQALSYDDNTETSAGWYWQFNRKRGFAHDGIFTKTPDVGLVDVNENSNWTNANDPCRLLLGDKWRVPLSSEWETVDVKGQYVNPSDIFGGVLRIHRAGTLCCGAIGVMQNRGTEGGYWSANQSDTSTASYLTIGNGDPYVSHQLGKNYARSIRCLSTQ